MADAGIHPVGILAIHEIVVGTIAHFGFEGHALGIVVKLGAGIVVPIDSPDLDRLDDVLKVLKIALLYAFGETAAVEFAVLYRAKTIDGLVFVELVGHRHGVSALVGTLGPGLKAGSLLLEEGFAVGRGKGEKTGVAVNGDDKGR